MKFLFLIALVAAAIDVNVKGVVSAGGAGMPGILVSDGVNFTVTDSTGRYAFHSDKTESTVFAVTPSGYVAEPVDGLQPAFWAHLTKKADECETHDFRFVPQDQKDYTMLFVTDVHLCNAVGIKPDKQHFKEAILPLLKHHKDSLSAFGPTYVMNLGDLSHDRYWYEFGFTVKDAYDYLKSVGFPSPMYSVTGNHDHDPAVYVEDKEREEFLASHLYREVFGPSRYSFNAGGEHWVVMNDAHYLNTPTEEKKAPGVVGARNYDRTYREGQLAWLEKDLSYVPDSVRIILCSHIPPFKFSSRAVFPVDVLDRLESIFAARGSHVTVFAGHSHRFYMSDSERWPHLHIYTLPATSGNMWETAQAGRSINLGGSIAGVFYAGFNRDGKRDFRYVSEEGGEHYYRAYDMNSVGRFMKTDSLSREVISQLDDRFDFRSAKWKNTVAVNCWWYRTGDKVEMWEDGKPLDVRLDRNMPDPLMTVWAGLYKDPRKPDKVLPPAYKELKGDSIFIAKTRKARSLVHVRISCADGKVFEFDIKRPQEFNRYVR